MHAEQQDDFYRRLNEVEARKKGQVNCIGAVLFLLGCLEREEYVAPQSSWFSAHLRKTGVAAHQGEMIVPSEVHALGVWHMVNEYYYHIALFHPEMDKNFLLERPGWNKALVVQELYAFRRRYQQWLDQTYELHFLQQKK